MNFELVSGSWPVLSQRFRSFLHRTIALWKKLSTQVLGFLIKMGMQVQPQWYLALQIFCLVLGFYHVIGILLCLTVGKGSVKCLCSSCLISLCKIRPEKVHNQLLMVRLELLCVILGIFIVKLKSQLTIAVWQPLSTYYTRSNKSPVMTLSDAGSLLSKNAMALSAN